MLKNKLILLPTDFSPYAQNAAKYALAIARKYRCIVDILYVDENFSRSDASLKKQDLSDQADTHVLTQLEDKLNELVGDFKSYGLEVRSTILQGKAWTRIIEQAEKKRCGLTVIASHGRTGLDRFVFGSVAERVVRHSSVPVLTVKYPEKECLDSTLELAIRHVLVPTDFSRQAENALAYAVSLCREFSAKLSLVHVVELPMVMPEFMPDASSALGADMTEYARQLLERAKDSVVGVPIETHLRTGVAYREICALVEESDVDLIVIPKHSGGSLIHVLFGSVAEKVVRRAPCPVITLPVAETEQN